MLGYSPRTQRVTVGDGQVSTASFSLEQAALQRVLYDLEAGMPFLFVDQLDVQVPQTTALSDVATGRVRVILGVSGQWQAGSRGPRQLTTSAHQAYLNTPLPA